MIRLGVVAAVLVVVACSGDAPQSQSEPNGPLVRLPAGSDDIATLGDGGELFDADAGDVDAEAGPIVDAGELDAGAGNVDAEAGPIVDAGELDTGAGDADAEAGPIVDAGELDAGHTYPCDAAGWLDCDGDPANGCERLAGGPGGGCSGLFANAMRCDECHGGTLCACGVMLADVAECVSICR